MLEKKTILLLYGEGRYDTSIMAVKDYLENSDDCYVVAISDKELYPFYRYNMAIKMYKFFARSGSFVNNLRLTCNTLMSRINVKKAKKSARSLKSLKQVLVNFITGGWKNTVE